jgi:TolB-like protein
MPSLIPGFEYDIFISYRQKDNKYDGWVTGFVDNLRKELEGTFKEDISVYFDINPHDGLLDTHDVGASLKEKLKCLVFIPIVSRTYCDPNSFAWEYEFKPFLKQASHDQYGLMVKLPDGNVANRVLPVRIHDLDNNDIKLCESVLGGVLRGVAFIYKEPGVNRSLTPDDDEKMNLNRTRYRNQLNKVALAIKEIVSGLKGVHEQYDSTRLETHSAVKQIIQEKSIIVLPFENMSPDPDQDYFSDGLTEEITTDLSQVHDLLVISRSSAMTFKGVKRKCTDIAGEVGVQYVLEGSVRKAGNDLKIVSQLIDANSDTSIWTDKFTGNINDVFSIQEKVSLAIVNALRIKLNPDEQRRISELPANNLQAFEYYFKSRQAMGAWTEPELMQAEELILKGLELAGGNTLLYSQLGFINYSYWNLGYRIDEKYLKLTNDSVDKIFAIEPDSIHGHFLRGTLEMTGGNINRCIYDMKRVIERDPNHADALFWICLVLGMIGKSSLAKPYYERLMKVDPLNIVVKSLLHMMTIFDGTPEARLEPVRKLYESNPDFIGNQWLYINVNALLLNMEVVISAIDKFVAIFPDSNQYNKFFRLFRAAVTGEKSKLKIIDPNLEKWAKKDASYSYGMAQCFALIGEKEKAMDWLDISVNLGGINYPNLNEYDPLLENIRGEERFKKLMECVKYEWENFEL